MTNVQFPFGPFTGYGGVLSAVEAAQPDSPRPANLPPIPQPPWPGDPPLPGEIPPTPFPNDPEPFPEMPPQEPPMPETPPPAV